MTTASVNLWNSIAKSVSMGLILCTGITAAYCMLYCRWRLAIERAESISLSLLVFPFARISNKRWSLLTNRYCWNNASRPIYDLAARNGSADCVEWNIVQNLHSVNRHHLKTQCFQQSSYEANSCSELSVPVITSKESCIRGLGCSDWLTCRRFPQLRFSMEELISIWSIERDDQTDATAI